MGRIMGHLTRRLIRSLHKTHCLKKVCLLNDGVVVGRGFVVKLYWKSDWGMKLIVLARKRTRQRNPYPNFPNLLVRKQELRCPLHPQVS